MVVSTGMRRKALAVPLILAFVAGFGTGSVFASDPSAPLFPKAIHLTRTTQDPLTGRSATAEEYYLGNRVVTIAGTKTVVVDYDRQDVTEIDRAAATYSITKFADVAAARPALPAKSAGTAPPAITRTGSDRRGGRNVDLFSAEDPASSMRAEIAVDRALTISRDAFDVLVGAAYPASGGGVADVARSASHRTGSVNAVRAESTSVGGGTGGTRAEAYGLPIEQVFSWKAGARTITATNKVTRVGEEIAPPELVAIPPGARPVVSHAVEVKRLGAALDSLKPPPVH